MRMAASTAQGGEAKLNAYHGCTSDGRYVYYAPFHMLIEPSFTATFVRFDTHGISFSNASNWQQMSESTAQGGTEVAFAYQGPTFDGRYVYYCPYDAISFIRFDTQGTSFTTVSDWQQMSVSTAQGTVRNYEHYDSCIYDGRYVYYCPLVSATFLRFDTQGTSFTTVTDWQKMSMSTAQGAAAFDDAYAGITFDGRYVYYAPAKSDTFLRFDTQGTSFTTAADWQQMSMSTAQGAAAIDYAYNGATFDGRYVYYAAFGSSTFLRFDTHGTSFTTTNDWQRMSMSTAQGAAALSNAYLGITFDGRYVYYTACNSDTFVRFDTHGTSFTTASDWQQMSVSTAQGAVAIDQGYLGTTTFDGRYVYYTPYDSSTFLRVLALPKEL